MEKKEKIKLKWRFKILIFLVIVLGVIFVYGHNINVKGLKVEEIPIFNEKLSKEYDGFKIVQFGDLLYGSTVYEKELENVIKEINALNADVVVFTGDLDSNTSMNTEQRDMFIKYLKQINGRIAKLAIIGDHDQKYLDDYKIILEDSNFILLDNAVKEIYDETNIPLTFIGLTNTNNIEQFYNNDSFKITLIHKPDEIKNIQNSNLVFAGHSLRGQIIIPFIGGIKKQDGANIYINNYYKVNNQEMYVTGGIGCQDIAFRTFNKPSITLYRLYNS